MSGRSVAGRSPGQASLEDTQEKPAVSGGFLESILGCVAGLLQLRDPGFAGFPYALSGRRNLRQIHPRLCGISQT